jgi:hypothetical protein
MNGTWCVFNPPISAIDDVKDFLTDGGKGENCKIELVEMEQEEFDKLPEFTGW